MAIVIMAEHSIPLLTDFQGCFWAIFIVDWTRLEKIFCDFSF